MLILFSIGCLLLFVSVATYQPAAFYFLLLYSQFDQALPEWLPYRNVPVLLRFTAIGGMITGYLLRSAPLKELFCPDKISKFMLLWWGTICFSFILARNFSDWGLRAMMMFTSMYVCYVVFRSWLRTERKIVHSLLCLAAVVSVSSVLGIFQVFAGGYTGVFMALHAYSIEMTDWAGRATGLCSAGPNAFAGFLNLYLPFAVAGVFIDRLKAYRYMLGASVALGLIGVVLSGTRGAALATVFTFFLAVLCFVQNRRRRKAFAIAFIVVVPVVASTIALLSPRLTDVDQAESVLIRYAIWGEAARLYQGHPIMGIGFGNFRESFDTSVIMAEPGQLDVHNLYLQFLTESGAVGLVVFLSFWGYVLWRASRDLRQFPVGSLQRGVSYAITAAVASMFVHGMVDFLFISGPEFGGALAIVLAIYAATRQLASTEMLALPNKECPSPSKTLLNGVGLIAQEK